MCENPEEMLKKTVLSAAYFSKESALALFTVLMSRLAGFDLQEVTRLINAYDSVMPYVFSCVSGKNEVGDVVNVIKNGSGVLLVNCKIHVIKNIKSRLERELGKKVDLDYVRASIFTRNDYIVFGYVVKEDGGGGGDKKV